MNDSNFAPPPPPPPWSYSRPKHPLRQLWDFLGAPLRMILLPDRTSERIGLTSLRGERFAAVLPHLSGRVLDVGAGDNALLRLHHEANPAAERGIGVDVEPWVDDLEIIESSAALPFADASFDTVCFIACLNHIPEREQALYEARRVLRPGGCIVLTMISRWLGNLGHAVWWYSEDKHREVDPDEVMGMDAQEVETLITAAGFEGLEQTTFVYGLNRLFVARKPA